MDALASSPLGWLCMGIATLLGVTVLCMAKRSLVEKENVLLWSLLPALLGLLCVAVLGAGGGLVVFCAVSLVSFVYPGGRALLPVGDKAVLITGSDTGIGHSLAKYLDNLGFVVFAGVLNEDGPGAEELRRTCSQRLSLLQLDITNATQVKEAYLKVSEKVHNKGLWGVVNNAGILDFPADGELLPMSTYRRCMEVNFFGAVEVSKTFLPLLRKSHGRLVNISSMAADVCQNPTVLQPMVFVVTPTCDSDTLWDDNTNLVGKVVGANDREGAQIKVTLDFSKAENVTDLPVFGTDEIPVFGRHYFLEALGGIPLPRYAAYGASKAALSMFSGVMRQELSKWGIKVAAIHPSGFQTGIQGTSELWDKQEKELIENLPADTKQDYGEDYLLGLKSYLLHIPASCDADLSPVLNAILHALLAKRPRGLYTPGKGAYMLLCIFCYFPLWFYDFFISKMLRMSEAESNNL